MNLNSKLILKFKPENIKWWQKPLVNYNSQILTAELAILKTELTKQEDGVWINSRGLKSGVNDLITTIQGNKNSFKTVRVPLPNFVSEKIRYLYKISGLKKGCPDLVIWNKSNNLIRLVEVKCPHWDKPSSEQEKFLDIAIKNGVPSKIIEWEFYKN